MAEKLILKARVAGIDFADVITSEEGIETATWVEQPLTLRDDEVSIKEADPTEDDLFSNENDAPEDVDFSGGGTSAVGSFIKADLAQLVDLMGGKISTTNANRYMHSSKKNILTRAVRFRLKDGGSIILPCAKGSVQFSSTNNYDGVQKYPFRFVALSQTGFEYDLIIEQPSDEPVTP